MTYPVEVNAGAACVRIHGRFDFSVFRAFQESCESPLGDAAIHTICIDLAAADYIDSAALGMLLLLRQKGADADKQVRLLNPRGSVKDVLDIAHFEQFFA